MVAERRVTSRTQEMRRDLITVGAIVPLLIVALLASSRAASAQSTTEDQYLSDVAA